MRSWNICKSKISFFVGSFVATSREFVPYFNSVNSGFLCDLIEVNVVSGDVVMTNDVTCVSNPTHWSLTININYHHQHSLVVTGYAFAMYKNYVSKIIITISKYCFWFFNYNNLRSVLFGQFLLCFCHSQQRQVTLFLDDPVSCLNSWEG